MRSTNQGDLFLSKEKQLMNWCRQKKIFSKADVVAYGAKNYYLRADRTIRDFVQQGRVRKLDHGERVLRNCKGNMAWYEFVTM